MGSSLKENLAPHWQVILVEVFKWTDYRQSLELFLSATSLISYDSDRYVRKEAGEARLNQCLLTCTNVICVYWVTRLMRCSHVNSMKLLFIVYDKACKCRIRSSVEGRILQGLWKLKVRLLKLIAAVLVRVVQSVHPKRTWFSIKKPERARVSLSEHSMTVTPTPEHGTAAATYMI